MLRSSDGKFIFSDYNHQILVFDSHGHFLRKIGSRGKARNEYLNVEDIFWGDTKRELLVLDYVKVLHFDFKSGKYIRTTKKQNKRRR